MITGLVAASVGSSLVGANAAKQSAKAQVNATTAASDKADATQRYIFDKSVALTEPQRQVGNNALAGMASTYGLGAAPKGFTGFQADPGYQFRLDQGQQGMDRLAAARGMRLGGATLKAADTYNQGMASQEYGNWYSRLAGLAGVGQTATQQQLSSGQNYGNVVSQNALTTGANIGNAKASGYAGVNDAFQGGVNNIFGIAGMAQAGYFK